MTQKANVVAIVGMEHFNRKVWEEVTAELISDATVTHFTEFDLEGKTPECAAAIQNADCLFLSMINFKDQADWLGAQVNQSKAKTVFAYESMPEVMKLTRVGDYVVANKPGGKGGMPEPIKKIAKLLVNGREEDTLYGYTKLMKVMGSMMKFMPAKARDFKNWMQVNIYWNQPMSQNVSSMFKFILREYFDKPIDVPAVVEMPMMGVYHPDAPRFFKDIKAYREWQKKNLSQSPKVGDKRRKGARQTNRDLASSRLGEKSSVALLFFRKHLAQERAYIDDTIRALEADGLDVLPVFVAGVEGHVVVRDWLTKEKVDVLISTIGFALVGGPAGSTDPGRHKAVATDILEHLNVPYIVSQPLYVQDFASWQKNGVGPMQAAATYALPEMDGAINPVILGAINDGRFQSVPDRLQRLVTLAHKWAALRHKPNKDKKVAVVVYDYPPGMGKKATAALLDVPRSLLNILRRLKSEGYKVGDLPESPERLLQLLESETTAHGVGADRIGTTPIPIVTGIQFQHYTSPRERERVEERWGRWPGDIAPAGRDAVSLGGLRFGNIYIGVQPRIGVTGDPMRLLFDKENTPHHQYLAFYRWLSRGFEADALIHVGMHGSAEWMPGLQLGMTRSCWPDALLGEMPQLYIYPVNNPSEANIAKRRGSATIVSHAVPPMTRSGLYKELIALKDLLQDYRERTPHPISHRRHVPVGDVPPLPQGMREEASSAEEAILKKVELANLDNDCPRLADEPFETYVGRLYAYLRELEARLITVSLHTFGEAQPVESQVTTITESLKARGNGHSLASVMIRETHRPQWAASGAEHKAQTYNELASLARQGDAEALRGREQVDEACREFVEWAVFKGEQPAAAMHRATGNGVAIASDDATALAEMAQTGRMMARALSDNRNEIEAIVHGLSGGFIPPSAGGDVIRDGMSVLPTGRNIHAIDPWRIPGELAYLRGSQIADAILAKHLTENDGQYPETIAQVLWGLDTIKTKGEAVGTILRLIGAKPAYDGQGKISHYELIPLDELKRPRIDVLMNLSPIFRDTFELIMDHLDRLVKTAARADEPEHMNFVRKHVVEALKGGMTFEQATARLFTQQQGQYGTYVDDMVEDSAWQSQDDLDALFVRRNSYAYGGGRQGQAAPDVLKKMLGTVGRVVQEIDSVEFGVADIDHYFSASGALHLAARKRSSSNNVKLSYVESYTAETKIDDLDRVLRAEYRTKLLNPRWYEGMLQHNHSGATEISNRFTYMLGWDAVSDCVDDWVYTESAKTYALDPAMRERLTKANPQAMRNIVGRLLEASGRGMWKADDDTIDQLKEMYADLEDRLEGIKV